MNPPMMPPATFIPPFFPTVPMSMPFVENLAPQRVLQAIGYVKDMARMYLPIVAIDNLGNMQVERAMPSEDEVKVRQAASRLLIRYFEGLMNFDEIEKQLMDQMQNETARRQPGQVEQCPTCKGSGKKEKKGQQPFLCEICEGRGHVMLIPFGARMES